MDKKVKAIVTRAVPYRDSDMVLTLVSLEEGRLTASARGCLKPRAKLRYAAEPMNFGEYMLAGKGDRYIVTDCVQYDSFSPVTADIDFRLCRFFGLSDGYWLRAQAAYDVDAA